MAKMVLMSLLPRVRSNRPLLRGNLSCDIVAIETPVAWSWSPDWRLEVFVYLSLSGRAQLRQTRNTIFYN